MSFVKGEDMCSSEMAVKVEEVERADEKSSPFPDGNAHSTSTAGCSSSAANEVENVPNPIRSVSILDSKGFNTEIDEHFSEVVPISIAGADSNETDSHPNTLPKATTTAVPASADIALAIKMKEERKKEREKKKEEEMMKKYMAEQEARNKIVGTSKCGRWLKNSVKLGEGGYKFVHRGYDREEARTVAWCEFKHEHVDTKEKRQIMFRETEIMLKMSHPHIVQCFAVFREWTNEETPENPIEEKGLVIIQELMSEGTLKQVIKKNFLDGQCILKFQLLTRWWHQIIDALRYMHHRLETPIIHRDLKSENCFLYGGSDEDYLNVKVGDFGLATQVGSSGRKTMLGTVGFMAPEIFDEMYDEKVDIYAFGMLMLEVMTNRSPYDECTTLIDAAAKTMSGRGPDIMELINNPNLSVVISACIHPLACFRPSAEELYCHPLFQMAANKTAASSLQPKTIVVEVEPNYETGADPTEVLERFVRSLANPETRNPRFNLRLRFRDNKMLQELNLDEGESLEFDLDIYKAEDQDIPDLITSLRRDYEDKMSRAFANPKFYDRKIISNQLDRLFNSIRLQMQFLVKCLLGRRWKDIMKSLEEEEKNSKRKLAEGQEGNAGEADSGGETSNEMVGCSNFEIIAKCKSKWLQATRILDREIQAYRKAAAQASVDHGTLEISSVAQQQQTTTLSSSNPLIPPPPIGSTGTPATTGLNASEGTSHGFTPPPPPPPPPPAQSSNAVAEAQVTGVDDTVTVNQATSVPPPFLPTAVQQDHPSTQAGSPTTLTQPFPPHPPVNVPAVSHAQAQTTNLRPSVPPLQTQPQPMCPPTASQQHQGNPLISHVVAGQMHHTGLQYLSRDIPSNLGAPTGFHSTMVQNVQQSSIPSFPVLSTAANSAPTGFLEQQPTSLASGFTYVAQQPSMQYPAANFPPNLNFHQQKTGEERLHEKDASSDTEVVGHPEVPGCGLSDTALATSSTMGFSCVGGGVPAGYATLPVQQHQGNQQLTSIASSPTLITKAAEQQRVAAPMGAKPKRKISQAKPGVGQQPLRYIIRITRLERESEGCDIPGTLRPTFYLEMPDVNNPNSELWKLSFRCNLSDTTEDIKLFEGCGYTQTNEEVDRAIKEAVAMMLRALQADENSIPLNHDYVFYPQLSPELIAASGRATQQTTTIASTDVANEEFGRPPSLSVFGDSNAAAAAFETPQEGDISDTTPSAESPVERNLQSSYPPNISSYINQSVSVPSYAGHSGLEEVAPIFHIGQPENVCPSKLTSSFPIHADSSRFYSSEPGNAYDSTESLPIYNSAAYTHNLGPPQPKEPDVFITLKVPAHAQSLVSQFAYHLCNSRHNDPLLIVPSDTNSSGYMSVVSENCSFLCSQNGIGGGFSVMPIPPSSSFLEVHSKTSAAAQGRIIRAPHNGYVVVSPDGEMFLAQRPLVILPGNVQHPIITLPLLSSDGSSVQLDDILTLLLHLREGMSTPASIPREHSTDVAMATSQQQIRQQDANYYSLPYGAVPMNSARPVAQAPLTPVTFTRQGGFRPPTNQQVPSRVASGNLASASHGDLSGSFIPPVSPLDYLPNRPSLLNRRQSQQLPLSTLTPSELKPDQATQQTQSNIDYLASLLSTNPSLFLATAAALCANNSISSSQLPPTALPNLWNNSTSASSSLLTAPTFSFSNPDAFKQALFRATMEGVYHQQQQQQQQQQQPIPSSGPANIPPIPTANSGMPVQPGLVPSNEVYDPNLVHFQPTRLSQSNSTMSQPVIGSSISQFPIFQQQQQLPSGSVAPASSLLCSNSDACLTGLAQPISVKNLPVSSVSQLQPVAPQPATAITAIPPPVPHTTRPPIPIATSAGKFVVTPAATMASSGQTPRDSLASTSSSTGPPPPPPPLPSPSPQGNNVIGNKFTVVSLDSGASHSSSTDLVPPVPPLPQPVSGSSVVPIQVASSGTNVQKKIPPKFTVSSAESDSILCSSCTAPSPHSDSTSSTLAAPSTTDSASTKAASNSTLRSPPSENDLPSECPPPPSTPAMSNQSSVVEPPLQTASGDAH